MLNRLTLIGFVLVLIAAGSANAVSFEGLGSLREARDISADGSVIVGDDDSGQSLRWVNGTITNINNNGSDYTWARGVSADGTVIVGGFNAGAYRWTQAAGMVALAPGDILAVAYGVSADGSVAVGDTYDHGFVSRRWEGGAEIAPCPPESYAFAASADGSVVVGVDGWISTKTNGLGFRWTSSGGVTSPYPAAAWGISDDGSVVAGEGFYWTQSGGLISLNGTARGVSADGSVAVGESLGSAFVWDQTHGMRDIKGILEGAGLDLSGWTLGRAHAVANDGLTIVGNGINPGGYSEGWVATIPEPAMLSVLAVGGLALIRRKK